MARKKYYRHNGNYVDIPGFPGYQISLLEDVRMKDTHEAVFRNYNDRRRYTLIVDGKPKIVYAKHLAEITFGKV